jgi:hypothetical protein
VVVAGAGISVFVALVVGVLASILGWDLDPSGTTGNRGVGVPLSVSESSELRRGGKKGAGGGGGAPEETEEVPSVEELREEQAVLNIIYGLDNRAR